MPSGFDVALDPFFNRLDIFVGVLEVLPDVSPVAGDGRCDVALDLSFLKRLSPASMLDTGGQVACLGILVRGLEVQVLGLGGGVIGEEGVHIGDFSSVGIHATSGLARLDVTPDHGDHVTLVVHEARIEVRDGVGISRCDVSVPTREGVFKEVEHGEEVTRWPEKCQCILARLKRKSTYISM